MRSKTKQVREARKWSMLYHIFFRKQIASQSRLRDLRN